MDVELQIQKHLKRSPAPTVFKVFKPKGTLKEGDTYKTKIELASEIVNELIEFGVKIELVLADSLYGEASLFMRTLDKYKLPWVLAIRSNHGVLIRVIASNGMEKKCENIDF